MARFETNGASIHYETDGEPGAPALLLIHAAIGHLRMWDPVVPTLAQVHHVIRYDKRGFGETRTDDVAFSPRDDAIALLDHLAIDRVTIVGSGLGGALALDLAVEHPDRVAGIVTVGATVSGLPPTDLTPEEDAVMDRMDAALEAEEWDRLARLQVELWAFGTRRDHGGLDPDFATTAYQLNMPSPERQRENPQRMPMDPPAFDRILDVTVPALVMVGDHDVSDLLVAHEYLLTTLPNADEVRFPNTAHLPSLEQPDEFTHVLCRWLAEHDL